MSVNWQLQSMLANWIEAGPESWDLEPCASPRLSTRNELSTSSGGRSDSDLPAQRDENRGRSGGLAFSKCGTLWYPTRYRKDAPSRFVPDAA
jgi:hypothetical protein